jgi:hypothetical protein
MFYFKATGDLFIAPININQNWNTTFNTFISNGGTIKFTSLLYLNRKRCSKPVT